MKRFGSIPLVVLVSALAACLVLAVALLPHFTVTRTRVAAMPTQWTEFRLNAENNPVIAFDGAPSWSVETHGPFSSSPAIVNGVVYLGNNRGGLFAIDVRTGQVKWSYYVKNPLMSNPLVYDGLVIVGEGNANSTTYVPRRQVQVGSGPNALFAVDAATGKLVWRVPLAGTGMPTPVIADGLLLHHNGSGGIIAVDPHTGRVVYRKTVKSIASMVGLLPLSNGLVVTTGIFPNRVFAINPSDGSTVWEYRLSDNDSGVGDCPPVTDGTRVFGDYIAPPKPELEAGWNAPGVERVYALDAKTGQLLWNVPLDGGTVPARNEAAIPLVARGKLYVGSSIRPYVHAIDTRTGEVLWTTKVDGPVLGGIVERDNTIYFGDLSGNLWAVNATTGEVLGKLKTATPFNVGSPVIVGDSLIIGSKMGTISAVPLDEILNSSVASR
jgi:outer membrane protein assembly factor BamB